MEDVIKDAILEGSTPDKVLAVMLDIVVTAVQRGTPIFRDAMAEPSFYRRFFRRWVAEGLDELEKMTNPSSTDNRTG